MFVTSSTTTDVGGSAEIYWDVPDGTGYLRYTVVEANQEWTKTDETTGQAVIDADANLTLAAGDTALSTWNVDYVKVVKLDTDTDPLSPTYGEVIAVGPATTFAGNWDGAQTFTPVAVVDLTLLPATPAFSIRPPTRMALISW